MSANAKKPWEYDEIVIERGGGHFTGDRWLYAGPDAEIGYVSEEAPGGAEAWTLLFKAGPKLVRALLAYVTSCASCNGAGEVSVRGMDGNERVPCPSCEEARVALMQAGVRLP